MKLFAAIALVGVAGIANAGMVLDSAVSQIPDRTRHVSLNQVSFAEIGSGLIEIKNGAGNLVLPRSGSSAFIGYRSGPENGTIWVRSSGDGPIGGGGFAGKDIMIVSGNNLSAPGVVVLASEYGAGLKRRDLLLMDSVHLLSPVPEPASYAMLLGGLGMGGLMLKIRRRPAV